MSKTDQYRSTTLLGTVKCDPATRAVPNIFPKRQFQSIVDTWQRCSRTFHDSIIFWWPHLTIKEGQTFYLDGFRLSPPPKHWQCCPKTSVPFTSFGNGCHLAKWCDAFFMERRILLSFHFEYTVYIFWQFIYLFRLITWDPIFDKNVLIWRTKININYIYIAYFFLINNFHNQCPFLNYHYIFYFCWSCWPAPNISVHVVVSAIQKNKKKTLWNVWVVICLSVPNKKPGLKTKWRHFSFSLKSQARHSVLLRPQRKMENRQRNAIECHLPKVSSEAAVDTLGSAEIVSLHPLLAPLCIFISSEIRVFSTPHNGRQADN